MFLKRLEIVGFKSFAERVSVDFVRGVTAVVGPNGSGKSNISDGIRWVLGEQSAKSLRGSKMEDIIFAGSDSRKPVNFAEISLVLDNEDQHLAIDYSEVSVTRRIYRSGDSEYLINKQTCRLKDIVDLFMDSGLGREAYSIIGQGKVEEILSSKAEERRVIFEEAAGVLKYKTRKTKAERKLAETQENLYRVEDILHELEGQIEPLQIQASVARDYLEKKAELKEIEVALMVHEITELHQTWEQKRQSLEDLEDKKIKLSSQITAEEAKVESKRTDIEALDKQVSQLQEQLLSASEALEKTEGKKEVLKERKKNFHQNRDALIENIKELREKRTDLKSLLDREEATLADEKEKLALTKQELGEKESELTIAGQDLEAELDRLKSDYIEVVNEQASLRNEIRYLQDQLTQQKQKNERLDDDNESLLALRKSVHEKKAKLEQRLSDHQRVVDEQVTAFRHLKIELEKKQTAWQKKEKQLYEAYQYIQQVRSRKDVLEEMQADFSGFFQGVKEILKARGDKLSGIEGAIAELVKTPKQYETALEIALGGATQHIVVTAEEDGRRAIQFLKKNRFGRATFLPLTAIKARSIGREQLSLIQDHPAFVGVAAELISYDDRYAQVIKNLLGHVVIATDLQGANALARELRYRYRIVTLEGDVVNPGGSMTGGSIKQKSNALLGRQRELETLTAKLTDMEEKTSTLEQQVKREKEEIKASEQTLEDMRQRGEEARNQEQQTKSDLREVEVEVRNVNERLSLYDRNKENDQAEQDRMTMRLEQLQGELERVNDLAGQLEKDVDDLTEKKKRQQTSKEELQAAVTEIKVEYAKIEERFANQNQTVLRLTKEYKDTVELLQENEEEFSLLEQEMTSNASGEESLDDLINESRKRKNETVETIAGKRQQRLYLQNEVDDHDRELKELSKQLKVIEHEIREQEVSVNRLDVELENRFSHLREEYELSYEAAKQQYPLTVDAKEARMKVKLIKLAIEELGTVNLGAIDEYDRIYERYEFLTEQQADLQEAKETLYRVIAEMDEEMTKRFEETFVQIRAQFQVVFKELFGGGEADLVLTNPETMLNTGVDIVARPPGKKLQHLALLSGGERALTAIALLFAILKVRPVPFCVLDEVEAALDEANVVRFANYLKEFSKETQFIVITHRKGTMEEADVLYGVTMQESGVSRLVSVRLEDTEELVEG
ncbi:chromosome segregation protein SMC [Desertibacillus haloalkaliphilus]|uniref:chromosome segregation protein SMC n=1 Tax=Desertibacillus haloalkaliphilus TaxID=1328930 RepID=UPI001C25E17E|nr:chromosome segregation protein SMC [Desertibacillus haloalkaliphilus]MBU8907043.1 chromosome segregation protein SMC [Desertibacillus haloalkaliphilus]